MKPISIFTILILVSCFEIKAQKPILVSEDSIMFGISRNPGISIYIPEADFKKTLKAWKTKMESGTRSDLMTEKGEMSIFGAIIKEIDPNPLNVYSKMIDLDTVLKLSVIFEVKKDQFIEEATGETELSKAKIFLKEFARLQYVDVAQDQAKNEEKKLHKIERELSSLEREKTKFQKSIQRNSSKIVDEKGNIEIQNNEFKRLSAEIVDQYKQLSLLESGDEQKEKKDFIKGLNRAKKKTLNSIRSSKNIIDKANNEIYRANLEIPKNERMQAQVMDKIAKQEAVYQLFVDKLNTIKFY
jgi:hypothetical protein